MDKKQLLELVQAAIGATDALGLKWTLITTERDEPNGRIDVRLRLRFAGEQPVFRVETKINLRPAVMGAVQRQLEAYEEKALLVADYVTPQIADELRRRGMQFIDAAGNAYINRPPLLVWITGQKLPAPIPEHEPRDRAFQPTGLKVLFVLLCRPDAVNLPYREIAEMAGVAHGTVGWVMPELPRLGFLVDVDKRRRLVERERLLVRWVEAYARRLRPKLLLGRYRTQDLELTTRIAVEQHNVLLGGETAAQRMTGHLRPGVATFYVHAAHTKYLIDLKLRPDPQGNVEFMKQFWNFEKPDAGIVPPILVYADLLATGDPRCFEAAQEMYGAIIDRLKH